MSHYLTISGFVLIGIVALGVEWTARHRNYPIPTLSQVFTTVMSTPMGRASTFAGWVWAGYHFFAR